MFVLLIFNMINSSDSLSDSDFHPADELRRPGLPQGIANPHTDCASGSFIRFPASGPTDLIPHTTTSTDNTWSIDFDHQRNDLTSGVVSPTVKELSATQKLSVAFPTDSRRRPTAKAAIDDRQKRSAVHTKVVQSLACSARKCVNVAIRWT